MLVVGPQACELSQADADSAAGVDMASRLVDTYQGTGVTIGIRLTLMLSLKKLLRLMA